MEQAEQAAQAGAYRDCLASAHQVLADLERLAPQPDATAVALQSIEDTYEGLKALVRKRLKGKHRTDSPDLLAKFLSRVKRVDATSQDCQSCAARDL